jgi:predicted HAD superfamily Cof-like phosphohydrolase|tara:strand:- start:2206 stop:2574 length:369 start_codon:yes stop_codon:yes gene_type:complete
MTNPFKDQKDFMEACDQTTSNVNIEQYGMYLRLIEEEGGELADAIKDNDVVEQLDALLDIIVVSIGAINSLGVDAEGAWNEVMHTNMAKIDPETGKVRKREDGKVLKPEGWTAPQLKPFLNV